MKKNYPFKFITITKICICLFLASNSINAQFTDSNLPIVIINTDLDPITNQPIEIPDDPKILATMKIIKHPDGSRNYVSDENTPAFLNYNGRIGIEIRGSSSQDLPKKGYGFTTLKADNISNNNVSLLGMPSENDWVLNGLAYDQSLIRDYLSYHIAREMGNYATKTEFCEVVLNGNYRGLYILQERIKINSGRVNILKMSTSDNTFPNVTGGYITKTDKTTGGDPVAWTMDGSKFIHHAPKPTEITVEQNNYIQNSVFENLDDNEYNNSLETGYTSIIDVPSFVDFMLVNEISSNSDGYEYSTFYHKDRNGKLRAGPVWDLNFTYGSVFTSRSVTNVWQFSNGNRVGAGFWNELFDSSSFKCYFSKRFSELNQPGKPLSQDFIDSYIDSTMNLISEAVPREILRWNRVPDLPAEIAKMKLWISNRITWMRENLSSFDACANVPTPPLVISKINYNPATAASNDLEFIEITNTGTSAVNLSGIYIRELGITYQFPYNSMIEANSSIVLASNSVAFENKYGSIPFGQYTRNLSNKSYKILLADAHGNTIDVVEYADVAPWPTAADGGGSYLKLIDNSLDNSLATNWIAVSDSTLSTNNFNVTTTFKSYPSPVKNVLNIDSSVTINKLDLYDIYGKLVKSQTPDARNVKFDMSSFSKGIYFIKVYDINSVKTQKVIKD
jgi:hypothetical protein